MIGFFSRPAPKRGCTHGKTPQQKKEFFDSLQDFYWRDRVFFFEQFDDLLPEEKEEFILHVKNRNQNLTAIKKLLDIIEQLSNNNA